MELFGELALAFSITTIRDAGGCLSTIVTVGGDHDERGSSPRYALAGARRNTTLRLLAGISTASMKRNPRASASNTSSSRSRTPHCAFSLRRRSSKAALDGAV